MTAIINVFSTSSTFSINSVEEEYSNCESTINEIIFVENEAFFDDSLVSEIYLFKKFNLSAMEKSNIIVDDS